MKIKDYANTKETFEIEYSTDFECFKTKTTGIEDMCKYYTYENYQSHNQNEKGLFNKLYKTAQSYNLNYKYKLIKNTNVSGNKILDYGCGVGDFALKMKQEKWEVIGYEPNQKAQEILIQNKISLINNLKEIENESLDIITLWHVLEHVENPEKLIFNLKEKLKPDGKLIIAVPNYNAYDAKYYKNFWAAYDVPRHLYHFQRKSFDVLAEKTNLKLFKKEPLCLDAFYISILSEKNKKSKNFIMAMIIGIISNFKSIWTKEYSSVIYFLEKSK